MGTDTAVGRSNALEMIEQHPGPGAYVAGSLNIVVLEVESDPRPCN